MKNPITLRKLLLLIMCVAGIGSGNVLLAQSKILLICDASFHPIIYQTTGIPPASEIVGFEAYNKGYDGYHWDFGDGSIDTGSSVNHHFKVEGKYYVTLRVYNLAKDTLHESCKSFIGAWFNSNGMSDPDPYPENLKCQATLSHEIFKNQVNIHDGNVYKPVSNDGIKIQRNWIWGDGMEELGAESASHIYNYPGVYTITLKKSVYKDPCAPSPMTCFGLPYLVCEEKHTYTVEIKEFGQEACPANITYTYEGSKFNFVESFSATDITIVTPVPYHPGDSLIPLSYPAIRYANNYFQWSFGDGTEATTFGPNVEHIYATPGDYIVKLTKVINNYHWVDAYTNTVYPNTYAGILPGGCYRVSKPCTSYAKIEVRVTTSPKCKAHFDWSVNGNQVNVKTNNTGENMGYVRMDFGDGDWVEAGGNEISSTHTYAKPGTYEICVKIATVPDSVLPYVRLSGYCTDTYCQTIVTGDKNIVSGTGNSSVNNVTVSAFPNPARDKVTFTISNIKETLNLKLYDVSGYQVKEVKDINTSEVTLSVSDIPDGIYTYSLADQNGVLRKGKLIVSH